MVKEFVRIMASLCWLAEHEPDKLAAGLDRLAPMEADAAWTALEGAAGALVNRGHDAEALMVFVAQRSPFVEADWVMTDADPDSWTLRPRRSNDPPF